MCHFLDDPIRVSFRMSSSRYLFLSYFVLQSSTCSEITTINSWLLGWYLVGNAMVLLVAPHSLLHGVRASFYPATVFGGIIIQEYNIELTL